MSRNGRQKTGGWWYRYSETQKKRKTTTAVRSRSGKEDSLADSIRARESREPYHFQRPHTANPDLDRTFHALHILQLDPFPPAPPRRFPPEQEKLLRHPHGIGIGQIPSDIRAELGQRQTANNRFVGLGGSMAPLILAIKSTAQQTMSLTGPLAD